MFAHENINLLYFQGGKSFKHKIITKGFNSSYIDLFQQKQYTFIQLALTAKCVWLCVGLEQHTHNWRRSEVIQPDNWSTDHKTKFESEHDTDVISGSGEIFCLSYKKKTLLYEKFQNNSYIKNKNYCHLLAGFWQHFYCCGVSCSVFFFRKNTTFSHFHRMCNEQMTENQFHRCNNNRHCHWGRPLN